MKACFFHDHPFVIKDRQFYTTGTLNKQLFQSRYLNQFESVMVVARGQSVDKKVERYICKENLVDNVNLFSVRMNFTNMFESVKNSMDKFDCAIIRLPSLIGSVACQECIKRGKPFIVEVVGCAWDSLWNHGSLIGKIMAPIMYLITKYYVRKSDYVIYVSNKFLQKRYPANGYMIGCSDVVINHVDAEILDRRLNFINQEKSKYVLGLVGSMNVRYKGHETAIRALAIAKNFIPNIRLRFLGGGDKEKWSKLAREVGVDDNIEFCGTLPSGEPVMNWMDETDIYLIPSLQEGLPRALVEAMSRGCPALGARTGGIPELLQEECLHDPKDWKKLAKDIIRLVTDSDKLKKYAIENFNLAGNYTNHVLDKRRSEFWTEFRRYVDTISVKAGEKANNTAPITNSITK